MPIQVQHSRVVQLMLQLPTQFLIWNPNTVYLGKPTMVRCVWILATVWKTFWSHGNLHSAIGIATRICSTLFLTTPIGLDPRLCGLITASFIQMKISLCSAITLSSLIRTQETLVCYTTQAQSDKEQLQPKLTGVHPMPMRTSIVIASLSMTTLLQTWPQGFLSLLFLRPSKCTPLFSMSTLPKCSCPNLSTKRK